MSTYQALRGLVASFGLAYFGLIFVVGVAYALWPSKRHGHEEAARIPLQED
ncbi:MAG: cbb3-type cytochrome c oxidase subunit 3 [Roseiarcus sp.]